MYLEFLPSSSPLPSLCPLAIAEQPEIREYILQLKTEFGVSSERSMENKEVESLGPRTRRLSVRRMTQADKTNMMKDSIKEEALIRRASMVKQVSVIS